MDLETTGADIAKDRIVEIAAVHAHGDIQMNCESFSTTVRVDPDILKDRGSEAFAMHGITKREIKEGATFEQTWTRFLKWINVVMNRVRKYDSEPDDDTGLPTLLHDPVMVLAVHNGNRFDFP